MRGVRVEKRTVCSVESAEGVGTVPFYARLRAAAERIRRWNLGREREDRDHGGDRSNSSTTKSDIKAPLEMVIPVPSSDSTEQNSGIPQKRVAAVETTRNRTVSNVACTSAQRVGSQRGL